MSFSIFKRVPPFRRNNSVAATAQFVAATQRADDLTLVVRLAVNNSDAVYALSHKFGLSTIALVASAFLLHGPRRGLLFGQDVVTPLFGVRVPVRAHALEGLPPREKVPFVLKILGDMSPRLAASLVELGLIALFLWNHWDAAGMLARELAGPATLHVIESLYGHDAFLKERDLLEPAFAAALDGEAE